MPKFRDRTCIQCGAVEKNTATRAEICIKCYAENKRVLKVAEELAFLQNLGYSNVKGPEYNHHGKPIWTFTHEFCGTQQSWVYGNILKQRKMNPDSIPCSNCGGKARMKKALDAYLEKFGYKDLLAYARYQKRVRALSDKVYQEHKHEINPHNLDRGMYTYHLDHKVTIIEGFMRKLEPEFIARKENLQMLSATENLRKGRRSAF
jgi:hypothetical protein